MRTQKNYYIFLIFGLAFFTTAIGYSQNMFQGEPSPEIREEARETANMWTKKLALSGKQTLLMEKKIIEFAMKKEELLQSKMREEAKTEKYLALQTLETRDMRDILTQPQYDRYLVLLQQRWDQQGEKEQD